MAKEKKKGKKGAAANFITRRSALKRLQLSLPQFRKLCILKGIHPRATSTKLKGRDKTYYFLKDIQYLAHDPIITKFREYKTWRAKVKKAKAKTNPDQLQRLKGLRPRYRLDHIIRERYPRFVDSLRDLNDALSMIALFSQVPQTNKIKGTKADQCKQLLMEFQYFIAKSQCLRKVFVSQKGIYYQVELMGEAITWLQPFNYTLNLPKDVDYKVMLSFLEFYQALVGFVNCHLYTSNGMKYPPTLHPIDDTLDSMAVDSIEKREVEKQAKEMTKKQLKEARKMNDAMTAALEAIKDIEEEADDVANADLVVDDVAGGATGAADAAGVPHTADEEEVFSGDPALDVFRPRGGLLFSGLHFNLSREVPYASLEFVIRSLGGRVTIGHQAGDTITHEVVDRPLKSGNHLYLDREYVQPQWVYDSVNAGILLPVEEYAPGKKLPPHLSPFVDDESEGYIPEQREHLNQLIRRAQGKSLPEDLEEAKEDDEAGSGEESEEDEENYEQKLLEEEKGEAQGESSEEFEEEEGGDDDDDDGDDDDDEHDKSDDGSEDSEEGGKKGGVGKGKKKGNVAGKATAAAAASSGDGKNKKRDKLKEREMREREEEEERDRQLSIMIPSKKKRRLYERIQYSKNAKKAKNEELMRKRKEAASKA